MRLEQYGEIIQLFNFIFGISIFMLCAYLYKLVKENKFIYLAAIMLVENIYIYLRLLNLEININHVVEIFTALIILKICVLAYTQYKYNKGIYKYLLIILLGILFIFNLKYSNKNITLIYNLLVNIIILYRFCFKDLYIVFDKKDIYINKLNANKKYISKIIKELDEELIEQSYLKDDIRLANYKLDNIIEVINIPIIMMDAKYNLIKSNKYFDDFLSENEINNEGFNFIEFIKRANEEKYKELKQIINNENDKKYIILDIEDKTYKVFIIKDYIENKQIILCQLEDITEICEKEQKLKQSELRYKTLMDVLSDGVVIHDGSTINYINKIGLDIFGIGSMEKGILDMGNLESKISKKSRDAYLHNIISLSKGLKDNESSKLELENGKIVNLISCCFNMGNKKMILTIVRDFSQHQQALDKLEEKKKTYSMLIQTLPEGIVIINKFSKEQVYINKFMMRMLNEMGIDMFYKIIDDYLQSGDYERFKTFHIKNNDRKRKIFMAIEEIPNQDNLLIVVRDLEIENQRESVYKNLQFIKQRNKFKTEFLSRVASNLRSPITTIFETNKFLEEKQDIYNYNGVSNYIKTVRRNSYRLKRLTNNIDEISKVEGDIYCRDYKIYNLVEYVQRIVKCCELYTIKKGLNISFNSNRKEILVYMDKDKIEKIILNILSNALKFTERGGRISVNINVEDKDIIIGIEDNGSGIPSNKIDLIFENFEQVDRSLSREAEGTGVGLYLSKKLALVHRAQIKVNSKIGEGSKFELILKENLIESNKENRKKIENIIINNENIDLEFSDIYLQ